MAARMLAPGSFAELASWAPAIAQGLTDVQAVTEIVNSAEAKADLVAQDYQQYLNRAADPA